MARSCADKSEFNIPLLLKIISETAERGMNRAFRSFGVTVTQMRALIIIHDAGTPIPEKQLEESLHISQPSTVGLVRRMESKGLIMTSRSPVDGRSILLKLTPEGEEIYQKSVASKDYGQVRIERGFSDNEKEQLLDLLYRVYENMYEDEEEATRR